MDIKKAFESYNKERYDNFNREWDWKRHDVFDENIRPKDRVMVRDEEWDANGRLIPAKLEDMEVNRIAYPLEQDIVDKHTAFTVGREPTLLAKPRNEVEHRMYDYIKNVHHDNKIKYHNKRMVRSWFSETMVAEYWWRDSETKELKVEIWSPFRGDMLVPVKNSTGKLIEIYRFYKTTDDDGKELQWGMHIDSTTVTTYLQQKSAWIEQKGKSFAHGFNKIPVVYMEREYPLCHKISTIRARIENIWSNSADCNDYHYAPKQVVSGDIEVKNSNPKGRNKTIKLENGANIKMLTWNQSTEMVKTEFGMLEDAAYRMMNTPRMSPSEMASTGATSGEAFKYVFASIGLAVEDHEETVGEFLQRRINFLLHAVATIEPTLKEAERMRITPELVPYSIDSVQQKDKTDKGETQK